VERYGSISRDLTDYTYQGIAFVPHTMSREQIALLRQTAFRKFYSRPSYLFMRLLSIRGTADLRVAAKGMKSLFWLWMKKGVFRRADGAGPAKEKSRSDRSATRPWSG
jgi:hypothetical protein